MERYQNRSGNSPITHFHIENDKITVWFNVNNPYTYSYAGKAGKNNVDIMKSLAISGKGLSAFITKNVRKSYD